MFSTICVRIWFERYGVPLVAAAIPDNLDRVGSGLTERRGSYKPGMSMRAILDQIVENGGEIMAHNAEPVITKKNQYDYDLMYGYFCETKYRLEACGYHPRGIIRAGGEGAVSRSSEIDRWLVGNYEYANMGTLPQYAWDRVSIQQSQDDLKAAILEARNERAWLCFMCHGYDFGGGETFTGEADLIELLEYCRSIGIDVVTCGYMFDNYGSSRSAEALAAITNG